MRRSLPHSPLRQKTLPSWALPTRFPKPRLKRRKFLLRLRQLLLLLPPLLTINEMINLDSSISNQPPVRQE